LLDAAPVMIGVKPESRKPAATKSAISGSKPPMRRGVEIGRSIAPICAPAAAGIPMACTSAGRVANGVRRP
jgi:hypothetical protein